MAKKTHVKVRLVPEAKPDSPFFYYVKISAVNVERIYTISKELNVSKSESKRGKNWHKNFKIRAKKRKLREMMKNDNIDATNDGNAMDINASQFKRHRS